MEGKMVTFILYYIVLLLFQFIERVNTLVCLQCSTSHRKGCTGPQKVQTCDKYHDMCFSLTHSTHVSIKGNLTETRTGYTMGCVDKRFGCSKEHSQCKWYLKNGYQSCRVNCCFGNLCNKKIIVNYRNKRRVNNSKATATFHWLILLSGLTMSSLYAKFYE